jgi:hypothetical protein
MIGWLPILMAALVQPNESLEYTSSSQLPIQVIYRCKIGCVRHEIMLEYSNPSEGEQFLERDNMFFLPHRMRYWNPTQNEWDTYWEEVKPQPHIKQWAEYRQKELQKI